MAENQFARPIEDTILGDYTDADGSATDIFESIDEEVADDDDYIQSEEAPANAVYVCKLSTLLNPLVKTNHIVRYRYQKQDGEEEQLDLVVQLREGYEDEGTPGTLIKEWTHTDVGDTWITATQTLSEAEANEITDYGDLFLRVRFNQV